MRKMFPFDDVIMTTPAGAGTSAGAVETEKLDMGT